MKFRKCAIVAAIALTITGLGAYAQNLIEDPSFESPAQKDKFGGVFAKWGGWIYDGECEFRVSEVAHSGKTSLLIVGTSSPKIRAWPRTLPAFEPGRYRVTAYLRGLEIGQGPYNQNTELMFNGKYMPLGKFGTFGWTKLTYVADVAEKKPVVHPSFGLMAPGYLWVDDVSVEKVGNDVPVSAPAFEKEEAPIQPPSELNPDKCVNCAECGYKNMPEWKKCYACGTPLPAGEAKMLPPKLLASFEDGKPAPFSDLSDKAAAVVAEHATEGTKALKFQGGWAKWGGDQDWTGYDFLKADFFLDSEKPLPLEVEIRDKETKDYWTRVNYGTILFPGKNTVVIPANVFVGEKSRPGRQLVSSAVTVLVFSMGAAKAPVYLDNVRLECDDSDRDRFNGLHAFSFGPRKAPLLRGMTRIAPGTVYSKSRGYGLLNAQVWRTFDALQPDVVYRNFICIEKGGLALDVPNGKYHVFANYDCPGGYWGELPKYRERKIICEGQIAADDKMDREQAIAKYFRFADKEDLYSDNTFDKYLGEIFKEKEFDAEVKDGQLNVEFEGKDFSCSVSCVVVFPADKMTEGKKYLASLRERRRADFDNYFRRTLHTDKNPEPELDKKQTAKGYCVFSRNYMEDIYPDTKPLGGEITNSLSAFASAGEIEPLTFAVRPVKDLGKVNVVPTDLKGPATIPAANIKVGYVMNRLSRIAADGSQYTIAPRYVMGTAEIELVKGQSKWFWANVEVPTNAAPGLYKGKLQLQFADGAKDALDVSFEVVGPVLPELDVPAGPWGLEIRVPWFDDEMADYNTKMDDKCLDLMRKYGCTTFSSGVAIGIKGKGAEMTLDFTHADKIMKLAKDKGMQMFVNYGEAVSGIRIYGYPAPSDPAKFGFDSLKSLYKHVFALVDKHSRDAGWIPIAFTVCDEPIGENVSKAAANAALLKEFATDKIQFAGATSMTKGADSNHLALAQSLSIANYNIHDVWSIEEARKTGGWSFYNGGSRWTYGAYMFMLRQKYDMKFRISWHWNCNAGDPYYALDCREDDYAWANSNARAELVTAVYFERIREGIDDYRYLLALRNLLAKNPGSPAAAEAKALLDEVLALTPAKDREGKNPVEMQNDRRKAADLVARFLSSAK